MKSDLAIKLVNISKKYSLHHEKPTLVNSLIRKKEEFWALKKINLEVKKGEMIGVIGVNGAGKTTLFKIISGITLPTTGSVTTNGRIVSLIDLQAGFHPELTGEENIYINGLLLGMSRSEIQRNFKKIVRFSELEKFIDLPLRTYSSGMALRLGFSVAVHAKPDIFLVDEVFGVGDKAFQKKGTNKFLEFRSKKKTILATLHEFENIKEVAHLYPKSIWLDKGRVKMVGASESIFKRYLTFIKKRRRMIGK